MQANTVNNVGLFRIHKFAFFAPQKASDGFIQLDQWGVVRPTSLNPKDLKPAEVSPWNDMMELVDTNKGKLTPEVLRKLRDSFLVTLTVISKQETPEAAMAKCPFLLYVSFKITL